VTITATDAAGNAATATFNVIVRDTVAPVVIVPADQTAEAAGPGGAVVNYPAATTTDAVTAAPVITYSQASGTLFPQGTTVVTVTATDAAGNVAAAQFSVIVSDTIAPVLMLPANVIAEATGPDGAVVNYPAATATDAVTASPAISYSQASGTIFPLGTTVVAVTATDAAGNASTGSFQVTVQDTTAPTVGVPGNIVVEATDPDGAVVNYVVTVADAVTANPTVTFSQASGTLFPIGTTTVTVTATDAAGNVGQGTFTVTVQQGETPPVAVADNYATNEDVALSVAALGVLANDTVGGNRTLTAVKVTDPAHGNLVLNSDGSFVYAPALNYNGTDSFTYKANDGISDSDAVTVAIAINAVNDAPSFAKGADQIVLKNAGAQLIEGWATAISAGPTTDETTQTLTFEVVNNTNPALFAVLPSINSTGTLTYAPLADAAGTAEVSIVLRDNWGTANGGSDSSAIQSFQITVIEPPTVSFNAAASSGAESNSLPQVVVSLNAPANMVATVNYAVTGGTATAVTDYVLASGTLTFNLGEVTKSLPLVVINDLLQEPNETVVVSLSEPSNAVLGGVSIHTYTITDDDSPVAVVHYITTDYNTLGNWNTAYGAEGYKIIGDATAYPAYVFVSASGHKFWTWDESTPDVRGLERLTRDGRIASSWYGQVFDVDLNFIDEETHRFAVYCVDWLYEMRVQRVEVIDAVTGTVLDSRLLPNDWRLLDNGIYLVWDIKGHVKLRLTNITEPSHPSPNAVISGFFFGGAPSAPIANDQAVAVQQNKATPIRLTATNAGVSPLTYTIVDGPLHGQLSGTAPNLVYTPSLNYIGDDSFTFKVNNGIVDSGTATISITVASVQIPPVAYNQRVLVNVDTPTVITLPAMDANNDPLTYSVTSVPSHGTLDGTGPSLTYTPAEHFQGTDTFKFTARDFLDASNEATIYITVCYALPVMVKDNLTTASNPFGLCYTNGKLYFFATDTDYVTKLWESDGTADGTVPIKAIPSPSTERIVCVGTDPNRTLFFIANGQLWKSDGTSAGTTMVKNGCYGPLVPLANRVVFYSDSSLWSYSVGGGEEQLKNGSWSAWISNTVGVGNTVFFSFVKDEGEWPQQIRSYELWKSDGTQAGTVLVKQIWSGVYDGLSPTGSLWNLVSGDELLFFTANDGQTGEQVWRSDGTADGTWAVTQFQDSYMTAPMKGNGVMFFYNYGAYGADTGVWVTDGTAAGTRFIGMLWIGSETSVFDGRFVFAGDDLQERGFELWASDGTPEGTILVKDIAPEWNSSSPRKFTAAGGKLLFVADDGTHGPELWLSDGTGPGTMLVMDINPDTWSSPDWLTSGGTALYFTADDGVHGVELWKYDLTSGNVAPVAADKTVTVDSNVATPIKLTATDANGDALTYGIVADPTHGTLTGTAPDLTYQPAAGYTGADSFTFTAQDNFQSSNVATVSITVVAANQPPVANSQQVLRNSDQAVSITLSATDPNGDNLTYIIVMLPSHGTLAGNAPNLQYVPELDYTGEDSFTFKVNDGIADSNEAVVSININRAPTVEIIAPTQASVITALTKFIIIAEANDSDGTIAKVEYFDGAVKLNESPQRPYLCNWASPTGGPHTITVKATDDAGAVGIATVGVDVLKKSHSITFEAIPDKTLLDQPFTLTATATSGLPVSCSIASGPATIETVDGISTVSLTGLGDVRIVATQSGDADFEAAPDVERTFTVAKALQTITFDLPRHKTIGDPPFAVGATASSGLPVTLTLDSGPATFDGQTLTLTGDVGVVTLTASQAGNDIYAPATVSASLNVTVADTTAPTITARTPTPSFFVGTAVPEISAVFEDTESGCDVTSVAILLDQQPVVATVTAMGFAFTPIAALAEGAHTVSVSVADMAGNAASSEWTFIVDVTPPVISNFLPAEGAFTNDSTPTFSASFSDLAGVDTASVQVTLNDVAVTPQTLTANEFSFTPTEDLAAGAYTITVALADTVGNATQVSQHVTIQTAVPPAPEVRYRNEGATEVFASGPLPQTTVPLTLIVEQIANVSVEVSYGQNAFQLLFRKTGQVESFDASLHYEDSAGNAGPIATETFAFADNGGSGDGTGLPPTAPVLRNLKIQDSDLTGDKTGRMKNGDNFEDVCFTNKQSVTITVDVSTAFGSIDSVTFKFGNTYNDVAGHGNGQYSFTVSNPGEGRYEIGALAGARNGDLVQYGFSPDGKILWVDRTAPNFLYECPAGYSPSEKKWMVFLNGNNTAANEQLRGQGWNTYSHDSFAPKANVIDQTGVSTTHGAAARNKWNNGGTGSATATFTSPETPSEQTFSVAASAFSNLEDSLIDDPYPPYAYTFELRAQDRAGNALALNGETSTFAGQFQFWVDTTPPVVAGEGGRQRTQLSHAHDVSCSWDVVQAWQGDGDVPLYPVSASWWEQEKCWYFSRWALSKPVPIALPDAERSIPIRLRDRAGNGSSGTVKFKRFAALEYCTWEWEKVTQTVADDGTVTETREIMIDSGWSYSCPETPLVSDDGSADDDLTACDIFQPLSGETTVSNWRNYDVGDEERLASVVIDEDGNLDPIATSSYDSLYDDADPRGTPLSINPLTCGEGANRRAAPGIITMPYPSSTDEATQPFLVRGRGIEEGLDVYGHDNPGQSVTGNIDRRAFALRAGSFSSGSAKRLGDRAVRVNFTLDPAAASLGLSPVSYDAGAYHMSFGPNWVNVLALQKPKAYTDENGAIWASDNAGPGDIGVIGQTCTLQIAAGFLGEGLTEQNWRSKLNGIRFILDGQDRTAVQSDPTQPPAADKVTILTWRTQLLAGGPLGQGERLTLCQTLFLTLNIGNEVPVGLYDIDINFGRVHAFDDIEGDEAMQLAGDDHPMKLNERNRGLNGAHRLRKALNLLKFEWVDHRFKPVHEAVAESEQQRRDYARLPGLPGGKGAYGGPQNDRGMDYFQDPFRFEELVLNGIGANGLKTITTTMASNVSDVPTNAADDTNLFTLTQLDSDSYGFATANGVLGLLLLHPPHGIEGHRKTFDAYVVNPSFGYRGQRTFYETNIGSNTYMTRRILADVRLDALPRVDSIQTMQATFTSTVPGPEGATTTGSVTLVETSPESNDFRDAQNTLQVQIDRITSYGIDLPNDFTATVTSQVLNVMAERIDAQESANGTLEFRTDILHNAGKPLAGASANAALGCTYQISIQGPGITRNDDCGFTITRPGLAPIHDGGGYKLIGDGPDGSLCIGINNNTQFAFVDPNRGSPSIVPSTGTSPSEIHAMEIDVVEAKHTATGAVTKIYVVKPCVYLILFGSMSGAPPPANWDGVQAVQLARARPIVQKLHQMGYTVYDDGYQVDQSIIDRGLDPTEVAKKPKRLIIDHCTAADDIRKYLRCAGLRGILWMSHGAYEPYPGCPDNELLKMESRVRCSVAGSPNTTDNTRAGKVFVREWNDALKSATVGRQLDFLMILTCYASGFGAGGPKWNYTDTATTDRVRALYNELPTDARVSLTEFSSLNTHVERSSGFRLPPPGETEMDWPPEWIDRALENIRE
jgi:ELWxxDGT repeat protein